MTRSFAPASAFFNAADAGAAGGGQSSGGSAAGAVAQGTGGSQGTGQAPTPISLTPDSMVVLPGSTQPVKWGEHSANYVPKSDLDKHGALAVQNFLKTVATAKKGQQPNPRQ